MQQVLLGQVEVGSLVHDTDTHGILHLTWCSPLWRAMMDSRTKPGRDVTGHSPAVPALPQTSEPVILCMLKITCQCSPKLPTKQRLGERVILSCIFLVSAKSLRNKTSFLTVVFPSHLEATDLRKKGLSPGSSI